MKKSVRTICLLFALPFLAGCVTVAQVPVPRTQPEREALNLRGVVITDGETEEVVQYEEVLQATWTPSSLSLIGRIGSDADLTTETRLIQVTEMRGLLVEQLDAGKTSAIVGGAIVGTVAFIAFWVTGRADEYRGG